MEQEKDKKQSIREEFAKKFISILESDKPLSWTQGWISGKSGKPYNGYSGRRYNGINRLILMLASAENEWNDNRFYTFKQVSNMDNCKVMPGSKATRVEYWMVFDTKEKKSLQISEYAMLLKNDPTRKEEEFKLYSKASYVFNACQIEGLETIKEETENKIETNELAEEVLKTLSDNMGVDMIYGGDRAFYNPSSDAIHMPDKNSFVSEGELYGTAFHEFGHATGAEHRLNRKLVSYRTDPNCYAMEELRAEIASTFISAEIGVEMPESVMENHMAYVQSWLIQIKENPYVLYTAIKDAERIADYIIENGRVEAIREKLEMMKELPQDFEKAKYEIWQLKDIPENEQLHFMCYDFASKFRLTESRYEKIYEAEAGKEEATLDKLYYKFNTERPEGYKGHSMSVSDVIVINSDGKRKAWYCDDVGFKEVLDFCTNRTNQKSKSRL